MKQSTIVSILLCVLLAFGWFALVISPKNPVEREFKEHIKQAEMYLDRQLYQKAIEEYDEAIKLMDTEEVWIDKMDAYALLYDFDPSTYYKTYLKAAKESVVHYPLNVEFQLVLADLYIYKNDYVEAFRSLNRAIEEGVDDEQIDELLFEVTYAYKLHGRQYLDYLPYSSEYYEVLKSEDRWMYVDAEGNGEFTYYLFAGPVGEDEIRLVATETNVYLIDDDDVIQGFLDFFPVRCGQFGDGLIPIDNGEGFSYYDILGDIQFDGAVFDYAGTFSDGTAAVEVDGKWFIIDTDGDPVDDEEYEEIVLYSDGTYMKDDVMIVKIDGEYVLYVDDDDVGTFSDVDIPTEDGIIAVCEDGLWGFVDLDGDYVIDPQYVAAKSFSNGLAAVYDGSLWGFINTDGELAIDYTFLDVDYFNEEMGCLVILPPEEEPEEETEETDASETSETSDGSETTGSTETSDTTETTETTDATEIAEVTEATETAEATEATEQSADETTPSAEDTTAASDDVSQTEEDMEQGDSEETAASEEDAEEEEVVEEPQLYWQLITLYNK